MRSSAAERCAFGTCSVFAIATRLDLASVVSSEKPYGKRANFPTTANVACSQTRMTFHPLLRSVASTRLSRRLLFSILSRQNAAFVFGSLPCFGHPCQKHPSTKTTTLRFGNAKSGRPGNGRCLRHPVMPHSLKRRTRRSSVERLPTLLTRAISALRSPLVKVSAIALPELNSIRVPFS